MRKHLARYVVVVGEVKLLRYQAASAENRHELRLSISVIHLEIGVSARLFISLKYHSPMTLVAIFHSHSRYIVT
ncbi:MAG: hypothetical protein JKY29_08415 [Gammaproteobacteria bacterium]|nr:hypothetical protein [Gammaproteobacteria bacterium]